MSYNTPADLRSRFKDRGDDVLGNFSDGDLQGVLDRAYEVVQMYVPYQAAWGVFPDAIEYRFQDTVTALKGIEANIARYFTVENAVFNSDHPVVRLKEDSVRQLRDIAQGKANLTATIAGDAGHTVAVQAPDRVFTTDLLSKMR